ncbi:MAG: hypothetical protein ACQEQL_07895 [Pseudomonadota bacterium]
MEYLDTDNTRPAKAAAPAPREITCRIAAKTRLAPDIYELCLEAAAAGATDNGIFHYLPGQYAILSLPGHDPRPYSIAGMPDTTRICFHVKDIGHGLSHAIAALKTEDTVTVSFPHGKAILQPGSSRPIIAIGGGLGLAPLLPIVKTALHHMPERQIQLFHGGVTAVDLYLEPVLQELSARYPHFSYTGVTENPINDFATGLVSDVAKAQLPDDLSGYEAYLSGAPAMVQACLAPLLDKGLSRDLVFSDSL